MKLIILIILLCTLVNSHKNNQIFQAIQQEANHPTFDILKYSKETPRFKEETNEEITENLNEESLAQLENQAKTIISNKKEKNEKKKYLKKVEVLGRMIEKIQSLCGEDMDSCDIVNGDEAISKSGNSLSELLETA